jgi:hypothetical protein
MAEFVYTAVFKAVSAVGATTLTASAIAGFASTYGLIIGGLALSATQAKRARRKARDQYNAQQVDRLVNTSSPVSPRMLVLGRARVGGAVFFKASTGTNRSTFVQCIALASHEIDALESVYFNDQAVTLDGSGNVTSAPYAVTTTESAWATGTGSAQNLAHTPIAGSVRAFTGTPGPEGDLTEVFASGSALTGAGTSITTTSGATIQYQHLRTSSNASVRLVQGTDTQVADARLQALFPGVWTSNHRALGVAYLVCEFSYSEASFPTGLPLVTALIRGAKVYDPRSGLTAWSENPALLMRHVYSHPSFGKATVTADEDARIEAAADACDTSTGYVVDGATTTVALYRAATVAPFGTPARELLDDLAQAMGGSWAFAGGELYLKPGVWSASVLSLTEADLAVISRDGATEQMHPIELVVHRERTSLFNTVNLQIYDGQQDHKQVALAPVTDSALVTRDGATLVQDVTLSAVGFAPQAQHVAAIMMRDARDPLTVTLPFKLKAYPVELFDTIDLTISRYGWSAKTFQVVGRNWSADGLLMLTLKETAASIFTLGASFLAQGGAANTSLPDPWYTPPLGTLTVTSGTGELVKLGDGTVATRVRVAWPAVSDSAVLQGGTIEVQYRSVSSTGAWSRVEVDGSTTDVVITDALDGDVLTIRARARTRLAVGDWGTQAVHTVLGKTEAPPPFDSFLVLVQPDGTRQFNFAYAASTTRPIDWRGAQIRYLAGSVIGPDWDDMTPLQDEQTFYTASPVELNQPGAGAWTFACRSMDTSGNLSTALEQMITLNERRLGQTYDEYDELAEGWAGVLTGCFINGMGEVESTDTTTWDTAPATWAGWTRWNYAPTSPMRYETPARDMGAAIVGSITSSTDSDGTETLELATSSDGSTWSAWGSASGTFSARYIKLRLSVAATVPEPVPLLRSWSWQVLAPLRTEYINDLVISGLTGSYRIGTGDIRIPLTGSFTALKRTEVTIQDSTAGTWTSTRIDQTMTYGPRWQFRLNGVLTDPAFVDFYVEGY